MTKLQSKLVPLIRASSIDKDQNKYFANSVDPNETANHNYIACHSVFDI